MNLKPNMFDDFVWNTIFNLDVSVNLTKNRIKIIENQFYFQKTSLTRTFTININDPDYNLSEPDKKQLQKLITYA